jgi:TonB family protein
MLLYLLFPHQELAKPLELTSPEELQKQYHFTAPPVEPETSGGSESEGAPGAKTKVKQKTAGEKKKTPGPKTPTSEGKPDRAAGSEKLSAITEVMKSDIGKEVQQTLGTISSVSEALGGLQSSGLVLGGRAGGAGLRTTGEGGGQGGTAVFGSGTLDTGFGSGTGVAGAGRGRFGKGGGNGTGNGSGDGIGRGNERRLQAATAAAPGQGLSPEQIARVVRSRTGAFRSCYESAQARDPKLQGGVTVSFTVSPDGSVTARISDSSLGNARVESCVLRTFNRLRFPAADKPTNANYPLVFNPGKQ